MGRAPPASTPLELALRDGSPVPKVLALLGHAPWQAHAQGPRGRPGFFALAHHPAAVELLPSFLAAQVDFGRRDPQGRSFFHALLEPELPRAATARANAWLAVPFSGALADAVALQVPWLLTTSDARGWRGLLLALEANHPAAVAWLMAQGQGAEDTHAATAWRFPPWLWALAMPQASVACLEACWPAGALPALTARERAFLVDAFDAVDDAPGRAVGWLEKMAAWEQRGGALATPETEALTDRVVHACRQALAADAPAGPWPAVTREKHRIRLLATGYVHRWQLLQAWVRKRRLEAAYENQAGRRRERL